MSSTTEASKAASTKNRRRLKIALYALLYASLIVALVIFAPGEPPVFIYQEF
jgi:hypothetical protein